MEKPNVIKESLPLDAVGRVISKNIPIVSDGTTLKDITDLILKRARNYESINYVYVTNAGGELVGAISLKEVFGNPGKTSVEALMTRNLVTARIHTDREKAALLSLKHNLKAIPVVDKEQKLLGVVTSDTILSILEAEHMEDIAIGHGIHSLTTLESIVKASPLTFFNARFPWLAFGVVGGLIAAKLIAQFDHVLEAELALASFIPLVVYLSDAVGGQTQSIFVRALAFSSRGLSAYVARELTVGALIGLVLASGAALITGFWTKSLLVGSTLGVSLFLTVLISVAVALLIPWIFTRLGKDPAYGSGPFATIFRDLTSVGIYFAIAELFLAYF